MAKSKEKQQGRILPIEDFNLVSFKFKEDGLTVKHHLGGVDPQIQTNECKYKAHPDLKKQVNLLQLYMASRLGLLEGWDFARENTRHDLSILEKAKQGHDEVISRMNVNGITYKGEGETYGVSITGSIKTPSGGSVGLSVPKITFSKEELGYEEEVKEICEEITKEVYNYLILKKKEQTNIEDQAEGFDNKGGVQTSILENEEGDESKE